MNKQSISFKFLILALVATTSFACRASALGNLFATVTPTPVFTLSPAPTLTSQSMATPTNVPTSTSTSNSRGVELEQQNEDTTLVIDHDYQYQFSVPKVWMTFSLTGEDAASLLSTLMQNDPDLANLADSLNKDELGTPRALAFNSDLEYVVNDFAPNLVAIVSDQELLSSMPLDFSTTLIEEYMKQQGFSVLPTTSHIESNAQGVKTSIIDFEMSSTTDQSSATVIRGRCIMFLSNNNFVMVILTTPKEFESEIITVADGVRASINLIKP
jgi:hypothetical protein